MFSTISDEFTELAFNLNLTQFVTGPSHHAGNTLDIALTNFDVLSRDAPILPANVLEKYVGKSKEQNAGKIGGKLGKWAPRNGSLAHFV